MSAHTYGLLLSTTLVMTPLAVGRTLSEPAAPETTPSESTPSESTAPQATANAKDRGGIVPTGLSRGALPDTERPAGADSTQLTWLTNYGRAWDRADAGHKMMLIWFRAKAPGRIDKDVERAFEQDASVRHQARKFVLVKLVADATIRSGGKLVRLLEHPSFRAMHAHAGLAIIELTDKKRDTYGHLVSAFPFAPGKYYHFRSAYLPVILNLPPGTITERTMIWAVRTHPEHPPSTQGKTDPTLMAAACKHCRYQARIGLQGHHHWGARFQRLRRLLGWRYTPVEVVAESWPGEDLLDSCIDCVDSWHHSPGHWRQVDRRHARYAYDIQRGSNGIWYGTGLFAN